jgi:hypothetical protein
MIFTENGIILSCLFPLFNYDFVKFISKHFLNEAYAELLEEGFDVQGQANRAV